MHFYFLKNGHIWPREEGGRVERPFKSFQINLNMNKSFPNSPITEKELYAVVWELAKWRQFILRWEFTVLIGHKFIENLFRSMGDLGTRRMERLALILSDYSFIALYLPGIYNVLADSVSRVHRVKDKVIDFRKFQKSDT